jgi:hypothetical protein
VDAAEAVAGGASCGLEEAAGALGCGAGRGIAVAVAAVVAVAVVVAIAVVVAVAVAVAVAVVVAVADESPGAPTTPERPFVAPASRLANLTSTAASAVSAASARATIVHLRARDGGRARTGAATAGRATDSVVTGSPVTAVAASVLVGVAGGTNARSSSVIAVSIDASMRVPAVRSGSIASRMAAALG